MTRNPPPILTLNGANTITALAFACLIAFAHPTHADPAPARDAAARNITAANNSNSSNTPRDQQPPQPTVHETLILELINRARLDPAGEPKRIIDESRIDPALGRRARWMARIPRFVDIDRFTAEMNELKPAPPLVFQPKLIQAARNHSQWMIHHNLQAHRVAPGAAGFTGRSVGERITNVGYRWRACGENVFLNAYTPTQSHAAFLIDWGKDGPGGMQPDRGHRRNIMNPAFKEAGIAVIPWARFLSITHKFAARPNSPRFVGGVVYIDRDGDHFYDIGEGLPNIRITASDGSSTTTWASGAYTLQLRSPNALTITAQRDEQTHATTISPGSDNIKFDWRITPPNNTDATADASDNPAAPPTSDLADRTENNNSAADPPSRAAADRALGH